MLRGLAAASLLCAALAGSVAAAGSGLLLGVQASAGSIYTGPGDIVSGATVWYGLRAYTVAIAAAGTQSIVDLRRASDNATCTAKIATNGSVDLTVGTPCNSSTQTVTAWLNNASSCTGAIATTVLTVASCTAGNLAVGLPVVENGVITTGTVITALGTGTGGAGTYTVNISQTAASGVFTAPAWAFVSKWYDQGANVKNAAQATAAAQPILLLSNGLTAILPGVAFSGAQVLAATSLTSASQPYTYSSAARVDKPTTGRLATGENFQTEGVIAGAAASQIQIFSPTVQTATAATYVWHAFQGIFNGASSSMEIDGASTSASPGTTVSATVLGVGGGVNVFNCAIATIFEVGKWPVGFSAGNVSSMNTNQHAIGGGW